MIFPSASQSVGVFEDVSFYHVRRLMERSDFEELCFVLPVVDSILVGCDVTDSRWLEKAVQYGLAAHIAPQSAHTKGLYIEVCSQQQMTDVMRALHNAPEVTEMYDRVVVGHVEGREGLEEFISILRMGDDKVVKLGFGGRGCLCK